LSAGARNFCVRILPLASDFSKFSSAKFARGGTFVASDHCSLANAPIAVLMSTAASCSQASEKSEGFCRSCTRKTAIALVLSIASVAGIAPAGLCADGKSGRENSAATTENVSMDKERHRALADAGSLGPTVVGTASRYNPYRDDYLPGGTKTSSGEPYDPTAWTAAIRIDLRKKFGGVRFGKNYRPTYALVQCGDKRAIVKINDVGRLEGGRVIDLNRRCMRYCNPPPRAGLIRGVKITLLRGKDWTPGPVHSEQPLKLAAKPAPAEDRTPEPVASEKPITVAAEQVPVEDQPLQPVASEKPINVAAEQAPGEDRTPEPMDGGQPIFVAAAQVSGDDWVPGPTDSRQLTGVAAAPDRNRYPPTKTEEAVVYSMLIATIALILRLPSAPPNKARGAERRVARPRARRKRKSRRKSEQTSKRNNRRKSRMKSDLA
jgi:peptidoglycan lytic transglycosylase